MKDFPELKTERLYLRSFQMEDKDRVLQLAGEKEIAAMTLSIPHPLEAGDVEQWIRDKIDNFDGKKEIAWAICERDPSEEGALIGAMGIRLDELNDSAEMGFWIGKAYWGRGYATEAGRCVIQFAFTDLGLHRLEAKHFEENRASQRVLEKLGMQMEGHHRQAIKKWDRYVDVKWYAILRSDDGKG